MSTEDVQQRVASPPEEKIPMCNSCNDINTTLIQLNKKTIDDQDNVQAPGPYDDLPPFHTVRYWMSMLATLLCLQSFIFCLVCLSPESLDAMATSRSQMMALELTARKTLVDLGVLTIVITLGFLLFLKESMADSADGIMSPLLVAYKLFQMIIAVDIVIRLLQGLHVTMVIAQLNVIYTMNIFVVPTMAACIEVTMIVASFIHLQTYYKQNHQQRILAIL